jgi:Protein of unknown function (DUF2971)
MADLEKPGHELEATARQVAGIAVEMNAVAKDLGGDREALRLRAVGYRRKLVGSPSRRSALGQRRSRLRARREGERDQMADEPNANRPKILYHYTDAAGLLGILRSQRIWATDAQHMNDSSETLYALDLIARLAAKVDRSKLPPRGLERLDGLLESREPLFFQPFVACFSELGDSLSQWRGYANNGLGYAVGIRSDAVFANPDLPPQYNAPTDLLRVIYSAEKQEQLVAQWLAETLSEGDGSYSQIGEIVPVLKNPGFHVEQEWRLLVRYFPPGGYSPSVEFRPSRFGLSPYVELACFAPGTFVEPTRLPIVHIVEGPRVQHSSLHYLLKNHMYWPVETLEEALQADVARFRELLPVFVSQSTVPYR